MLNSKNNIINTATAPHCRSHYSYQRYTRLMIIALLPCVIFALWNTGYHANTANSFWTNIFYGAMIIIPILTTAIIVTGFWQQVFATVRNKKTHEGFILLPLLFTLTLPPSIPLWQVATGMSFGIVIGKEIFGGLGMNIVNPVLVGRVFLFFAYPDQLSGNSVWHTVDGVSAATALSTIKSGGFQAINLNWSSAFAGNMVGSLGETSTLACLVGGLFLILLRIISWRIISGIVMGTYLTTLLFNLIGSDTNAMFALQWHWHWVLGGLAFASFFLATDSTTSSQTNSGRWIYGILIGVLVIVLRVVNPTAAEGITFAILLANIIAPLIDHLVIQANIKRRKYYQINPRSITGLRK